MALLDVGLNYGNTPEPWKVSHIMHIYRKKWVEKVVYKRINLFSTLRKFKEGS